MSQYESEVLFSLFRAAFLHHLLLIKSNLPTFRYCCCSFFSFSTASCCSNDFHLIPLSFSPSASCRQIAHNRTKISFLFWRKSVDKFVSREWWVPREATSIWFVDCEARKFANDMMSRRRGRDAYQMARHYDNLRWKIDRKCFFFPSSHILMALTAFLFVVFLSSTRL